MKEHLGLLGVTFDSDYAFIYFKNNHALSSTKFIKSS